ncbi:MAG: S49 family peptidase [Rhodocyclaceae bacterium]|nr:S49 family peptidase [Rhodocyclaceae bacterium]
MTWKFWGKGDANLAPAGLPAADASLRDTQGVLADELARMVLADYLANRRSERFWRRLRVVAFVLIAAAGAASAIAQRIPQFRLPGWHNPARVAVVRIEGEIGPGTEASAARVIPALRAAFASHVDTVALVIDSPGGAPAEAERIYVALDQLRSKTGKRTVAVAGSVCASAAYMIALHADRIVAGEYSLVGSVGAKINAWDLHRAAEWVRASPRVYASGELKTMLDPFVPATPAADRAAQALVSEIGGLFASGLRERRGARLADMGENLASGKVWTGHSAQALGLIDQIGTLESVFDGEVEDFGPARAKGFFGEARSLFAGLAELAAMLRADMLVR